MKKKVPNFQENMSQEMACILSDTYVLLVKTHGFCWNVTGCGFYNLRLLLKEQYIFLQKAVDDTAERIRSLGAMPDGSMDAFLQNTVIKEAGTKPMSAPEMIADLLVSHGLIQERVKKAAIYASSIPDFVTKDLLVKQLAFHEKSIWMMQSLLGSA